MSFVKGKLKASRDAIQAKDWRKGADEAAAVLEHEKDNYNALVFQGLAFLHLGQYDDSEKAYLAATEAQPGQVLAWQGLEKFYGERKQVEKQRNVLQRLMDLALDADDATKCAEALQRLVRLTREDGSRSDIASTLGLYLPTSQYYNLLSKLPQPDQSKPMATSTFEAEMVIHLQSLRNLQEMIALLEEAEQIQIDKEVEKRRTRLDSASKNRETLRNEIGVEIWRQSKLPELYDSVLSHTDASDEARREAEHKLLVYRYTFLQALPSPRSNNNGPRATVAKDETTGGDEREKPEKQAALQNVLQLASGIVAIGVADELAWTLCLEWNNVFSPVEIKSHLLRSYIDHFPRSGLSQSLKALLQIIQDEQYLLEENERHERLDIDMATPDPLSLAIIGIEESPTSILAHRITASLYLLDQDWISCTDVANTGLELVRRCENKFDLDLSLVRSGFELTLATALTHLFPPQHHARAQRLAESVLSKKEGDIDATLCKAYIAQVAKRWDQARLLFTEVETQAKNMSALDKVSRKLGVSPEPLRESRMEIAWCDVQLGRVEEGKEALKVAIKEYDSSPSSNEGDRAKAWWRLGSCLWQMGGSDREDSSKAFTCFITALKRDSSYAPAFTSLGFYYKLVSSPPDMKRSAKCFQKAFELDAREDTAAFELAHSYADEDEWDLVYLVAQRTIEGEGGGLALKGEIQSQRRHITRNAWAWTAIGSAELLRDNYEKAIVAFQIALRTFPHDAQLWMRLGEAYTASGRLTAGLKTFEKAVEIFGGGKEAWQPKFNIADIQRQQGLYQESLDTLIEIRSQKNDMVRILQACAEMRLLLALDQARQGYTTRAVESIYSAICDAVEVLEDDRTILAAWKVITDALHLCFETTSGDVEQSILLETMDKVLPITSEYQIDESLPSVSAVTLSSIKGSDGKKRFLLSNIYLNKLRILLHHNDEVTSGSVWMDLAVGLHHLYTVQESIEDRSNAMETKGQAIACAKEALKMEPGNGAYWIGLGNLVFSTSINLAQHCYSKAIESDARDAVPWTCLGLLYLQHEDNTLAQECFTKAQTIDPDYVDAWVGRALLAKRMGQSALTKKLFKHAYAVDEGSNMEAAYGFAASNLLDEMPPRPDLLSASFALSSYLTQRPEDVSGLHLSALCAERLDDLDTSVDKIQQASTILEAQYEQDESIAKARLFAICMGNLGRLEVKRGDYEAAKSSFEMCLGLLVEDEEENVPEDVSNISLSLNKTDLKRAKIGAHCGSALAQFSMGQKAEAMEEIRQILEEVEIEQSEESKEELLILLAKMHWSIKERQEGESIIMEALSTRPKSLKLLLMLGSVSCVNGDEQQLQMVEGELKELLPLNTMNEKSRDEVKFFLTSAMMQRQDYSGVLKSLREDASSSFTSQLNLVKILLLLAMKAQPETEVYEEICEGRRYLEEALSLGLQLTEMAMHDTSSRHHDLLVQGMLSCTLALSLLGRIEEAKDMATRCAILQPGVKSHWLLLQHLHHYS